MHRREKRKDEPEPDCEHGNDGDLVGFDFDLDKCIPKTEAIEVIERSSVIDSEEIDGCFWRGYSLDDKFYIGLCDESDIWEVPSNIFTLYVG